jgi:hypothetical protein
VEEDVVEDSADEKNTPFFQNEFTTKRGPKTPEGKKRSQRNALKHGIFAQTPVLPLVEDEGEWLALRQDVIDWFGLEGAFQETLGERVAMLLWRLKRVARMETEDIRHYQADVPEDWVSSMHLAGLPIPDRKTKEQVEEMRRMVMARLLPGEETMDKILRYESRLNRYMLQTLYMIMVLKGLIRPRGGKSFAPDLDQSKSPRRMQLLPGEKEEDHDGHGP